jgi:hypothetical protein
LIIAIISAALFVAKAANRLKPLFCLLPFYILSLIAAISIQDSSLAIYFQVIYNLVLIAIGIWLVLEGIHNGISHYFFLGTATILLTAFMRYIDLIGDYIGGAALFMVCAMILLGAAKYWRNTQGMEGAP